MEFFLKKPVNRAAKKRAATGGSRPEVEELVALAPRALRVAAPS